MPNRIKARRALKLCTQCGEPVVRRARMCAVHLLADRLRKRREGGFRARVDGGRGRPSKFVAPRFGSDMQKMFEGKNR